MSLANHIAELRKKHQSLHDEVEELERSVSACPTKIRKLKAEKLRLKEDINVKEQTLANDLRTQLNAASTGGRSVLGAENRQRLADELQKLTERSDLSQSNSSPTLPEDLSVDIPSREVPRKVTVAA